jgi:heme/copper-type cytochrome/quinol oxidase subunit 2
MLVSSDLGQGNLMSPRSNIWLLLLLFSPVVLVVLSSFDNVFAQEPQQFVERRVEIWALFYRLMVAAFVVGAVVQGAIVYVCWRFRESHKQNRIKEIEGV